MIKPAKQATTHRSSGISPAWLVPLVALVVAGWLGFQSWRERGVEIVITFDSAAGIEVNKTELRFKDVRVGVVRQLHLSDDLNEVRVTVEVDHAIADKLSSNSRFWVVTPKISASGISGLNTLISGVFLGVDPGDPGTPLEEFEGSLTPLSVGSETEGTRFRLRADSLGSLSPGSPIYYREVPAGEVLDYQLLEGGRFVSLDIFVRAPYDRYVHRESRFWNVSGFGVELSDRGLKAQVSSLASVVAGGIAFDTPDDLINPQPAEEQQEFLLYPDEQAVSDGIYTLRYYYRLNFVGSVRGLNVGASVEFRGIPVGEVVSVRFAEPYDQQYSIDVLIAFEPERLQGPLQDYQVFHARLDELVAGGMKAQLKSGNLLTGALFVDLVMEPELPGQIVEVADRYPLLPTADAPLDQLSRQMTELLRKANEFPLEQLGQDLSASLSSLRAVLAEVEQQRLPLKLEQTLGEIDGVSGALRQTLAQTSNSLLQLASTLHTLEKTVAPDAPLVYELQQMAREVKQASVSFRRFTDELNRTPNALIFGKEE